MSEQIAIDLKVLGHSFRLASTADQQDELQRAAQLLNEKYDEFRRKAPRMEPSKLIIMVALELMQEVLTMNKSLQQYAHCERLLQLNNRVFCLNFGRSTKLFTVHEQHRVATSALSFILSLTLRCSPAGQIPLSRYLNLRIEFCIFRVYAHPVWETQQVCVSSTLNFRVQG